MSAINPVICLMGPTASGKTEFALSLTEDYPIEIVSVDSALVYRGMDIGTAKPGKEILQSTPHALVDIRDPEETYSAGNFVRDAHAEIMRIASTGRIPLLVGGTMLYFRALIDGIARLPESDRAVRDQIDAHAAEVGWPALHAELESIDSAAAARINRNDSQRIQRALEVYRVTGKTLTELHDAGAAVNDGVDYLKIALLSEARSALHERIALRLNAMIEQGFVDEVRGLMGRPGLTRNHASMRAVGYRQIWSYLESDGDLAETLDKARAATRQLCKRQFTWLRRDADLRVIDPLETNAFGAISALVRERIGP